MIDDISLELNTIETEDDFFQLGQSQNFKYYQVHDHIRNKLYPTSYHEPGIVYNAKVHLDQLGKQHQRKSYMFFSLLGDLGGVRELIVLSFGILLLPISEHSFIMKAAKFLFFARTS